MLQDMRKNDTQLIGSFVSHPGPIGEFRGGIPIIYYTKLPPIKKYTSLNFEDLKQKVLIWTMTVSPFLPTSILNELDGIVVAGMGTSSLSDEIIDQLSEYTSKISVVLVSRCVIGQNVDDDYYQGSLYKYQKKGFLITKYMDLNPIQAHIKLVFEISLKSKKKLSNSFEETERIFNEDFSLGIYQKKLCY